jgi:hypothetical protein
MVEQMAAWIEHFWRSVEKGNEWQSIMNDAH